MYTYQLNNPIKTSEGDSIEFIDIVEPMGNSIEFSKACATLANQFMYSQGKFASSPEGKAMMEKNESALAEAQEKKAKNKKLKDEGLEVEENFEPFENASSINAAYSMVDPNYLANMVEKFSAVYKLNQKIIQCDGKNLATLNFNRLNFRDLTTIATAYCLAFMLG